MTTESTDFTDGEVLALLAPVVKEELENLDHYVIITRGKCHNCPKRDGVALVSSITNMSEFIELLTGAGMQAFLGSLEDE